jgi:hypothetical protein
MVGCMVPTDRAARYSPGWTAYHKHNMKSFVILWLLFVPVTAAFVPSRNCYRASVSQISSSAEESQPDASISTVMTIQSNPFLPLLSDGLRRISIATNKATSDQLLSTPSLQRLRQQVKKLTKVAPSTLGDHAGLGLIATKNIKQGTIVGFYPAHALGYELVAPTEGNCDSQKTDLSMFIACSNEDEIYFQANPHGNSPYLHATDQPIFQRHSLLSSLFDESKKDMTPPLYLDVNPKRNDELDDVWRSHYINDGASLLRSTAVTEEVIEEYYIDSTRAKNCCHIPFGPSPFLATITTKKIKKDEELFTSYGVVYWLGSVDDPGDDSNVAVMTEKIQTQIVETARDLQRAMASASTGYSNEISELEQAFSEL